MANKKRPVFAVDRRSRVKAQDVLTKGLNGLTEHEADRDSGDERSITKAVQMFNVLYDKDLTDEQGWMFMTMVKQSRSIRGYNPDNYVDGAAFFALSGEAASDDRS